MAYRYKLNGDWRQRAAFDGRCYHVDVGAFSTAIVGGGNGTAVTADEPECVISVPTGSVILPLRVSVQCQTPLLVTDADEAEIILAWDQAAAQAGDGTSTAETCLQMFGGSGSTSLCTATSAYTGAMTTPTLSVELARSVVTGDMNGAPANALWGKLGLLYVPETAPIIVGPAMLIIYWGGTVATNGFAQVEWLELLVGDL